MRCFKIGPDTVAAEDEADARAALAETYDDVNAGEACVPVPDDEVIAVWVDDAPPPSAACCAAWPRADARGVEAPRDHHPNCPVGRPRKTAAEWAREGRGLVCSTEY